MKPVLHDPAGRKERLLNVAHHREEQEILVQKFLNGTLLDPDLRGLAYRKVDVLAPWAIPAPKPDEPTDSDRFYTDEEAEAALKIIEDSVARSKEAKSNLDAALSFFTFRQKGSERPHKIVNNTTGADLRFLLHEARRRRNVEDSVGIIGSFRSNWHKFEMGGRDAIVPDTAESEEEKRTQDEELRAIEEVVVHNTEEIIRVANIIKSSGNCKCDTKRKILEAVALAQEDERRKLWDDAERLVTQRFADRMKDLQKMMVFLYESGADRDKMLNDLKIQNEALTAKENKSRSQLNDMRTKMHTIKSFDYEKMKDTIKKLERENEMLQTSLSLRTQERDKEASKNADSMIGVTRALRRERSRMSCFRSVLRVRERSMMSMFDVDANEVETRALAAAWTPPAPRIDTVCLSAGTMGASVVSPRSELLSRSENTTGPGFTMTHDSSTMTDPSIMSSTVAINTDDDQEYAGYVVSGASHRSDSLPKTLGSLDKVDLAQVVNLDRMLLGRWDSSFCPLIREATRALVRVSVSNTVKCEEIRENLLQSMYSLYHVPEGRGRAYLPKSVLRSVADLHNNAVKSLRTEQRRLIDTVISSVVKIKSSLVETFKEPGFKDNLASTLMWAGSSPVSSKEGSVFDLIDAWTSEHGTQTSPRLQIPGPLSSDDECGGGDDDVLSSAEGTLGASQSPLSGQAKANRKVMDNSNKSKKLSQKALKSPTTKSPTITSPKSLISPVAQQSKEKKKLGAKSKSTLSSSIPQIDVDSGIAIKILTDAVYSLNTLNLSLRDAVPQAHHSAVTSVVEGFAPQSESLVEVTRRLNKALEVGESTVFHVVSHVAELKQGINPDEAETSHMGVQYEEEENAKSTVGVGTATFEQEGDTKKSNYLVITDPAMCRTCGSQTQLTAQEVAMLQTSVQRHLRKNHDSSTARMRTKSGKGQAPSVDQLDHTEEGDVSALPTKASKKTKKTKAKGTGVVAKDSGATVADDKQKPTQKKRTTTTKKRRPKKNGNGGDEHEGDDDEEEEKPYMGLRREDVNVETSSSCTGETNSNTPSSDADDNDDDDKESHDTLSSASVNIEDMGVDDLRAEVRRLQDVIEDHEERDFFRDMERDRERDHARDGERDAKRDEERDMPRDMNRDAARDAVRDQRRDAERDLERDRIRDEEIEQKNHARLATLTEKQKKIFEQQFEDRCRRRDAERDPARDLARDVTRDDARDALRDKERDPPRDEERDVVRDKNRDPIRDQERDLERDEARDRVRDEERDLERDGRRDDARDAFRDDLRDYQRDLDWLKNLSPDRDNKRDQVRDSVRDRERDAQRDYQRDDERDEVRDLKRDEKRDAERDKVRDEERDNIRDRVRDEKRDHHRDAVRDKERDSERDVRRDVERDNERDKARDGLRDGQRDGPRDIERDKFRDEDRDKYRDVERDKNRDATRDKMRDHERDLYRDERHDEKRDAKRDEERDMERDAKRDVHRDAERDKKRDKTRDADRDRERDERRDMARDQFRDMGRDSVRDRVTWGQHTPSVQFSSFEHRKSIATGDGRSPRSDMQDSAVGSPREKRGRGLTPLPFGAGLSDTAFSHPIMTPPENLKLEDLHPAVIKRLMNEAIGFPLRDLHRRVLSLVQAVARMMKVNKELEFPVIDEASGSAVDPRTVIKSGIVVIDAFLALIDKNTGLNRIKISATLKRFACAVKLESLAEKKRIILSSKTKAHTEREVQFLERLDAQLRQRMERLTLLRRNVAKEQRNRLAHFSLPDNPIEYYLETGAYFTAGLGGLAPIVGPAPTVSITRTAVEIRQAYLQETSLRTAGKSALSPALLSSSPSPSRPHDGAMSSSPSPISHHQTTTSRLLQSGINEAPSAPSYYQSAGSAVGGGALASGSPARKVLEKMRREINEAQAVGRNRAHHTSHIASSSASAGASSPVMSRQTFKVVRPTGSTYGDFLNSRLEGIGVRKNSM